MKKLRYILFTFFVCIISISCVKANTICKYNDGNNFSSKDLEITCTLNAYVAECTQTKGAPFITMSNNYTFRRSEFNALISDDCASNLYYKLETEKIGTQINYKITDLVVNRTTGYSLVTFDKNNSTIENNSTVEQIITETKPTTPSSNEKTPDADWNPVSFCHKNNVSSTFRIIGWVIFIIKILVPIILIIFGSIDFGKAILASKEDEIKKAGISLLKRSVIGIVIFFIPTLINFVISQVGGEDIFDKNNNKNNSFGYCTYCMLNPSDDSCGNLIGGK